MKNNKGGSIKNQIYCLLKKQAMFNVSGSISTTEIWNKGVSQIVTPLDALITSEVIHPILSEEIKKSRVQ